MTMWLIRSESIVERLDKARLGMTHDLFGLLQEAKTEIERLKNERWGACPEYHDMRAEIERLRGELAQVREILGDREDEITRLQAERRVIPGTNIPDAGTPSY